VPDCQRSKLADAIRYALRHWQWLGLFLEDGRIEDSNTVERTIRPIKLGCKNHLFADSDGSAECWATIASLIQTAKLNDVEPFAYLRDVLERIVSGKTNANDLAAPAALGVESFASSDRRQLLKSWWLLSAYRCSGVRCPGSPRDFGGEY
jgi:hypothetical protein